MNGDSLTGSKSICRWCNNGRGSSLPSGNNSNNVVGSTCAYCGRVQNGGQHLANSIPENRRLRSSYSTGSTETRPPLPNLQRQVLERRVSGSEGRLNSISNFFKRIGKNNLAEEQTTVNLIEGKGYKQETGARNRNLNGTAVRLPPISPDANGKGSPFLQRETEALKSKHMVHILTKSMKELEQDLIQAVEADSWEGIKEYYSTVFSSFASLNTAFTEDSSVDADHTTNESSIAFDKVYEIYSVLILIPVPIQKTVLKAVFYCLLSDKRLQPPENVRAYIILLLNPQFHNIATYSIFAHLLHEISSSNERSLNLTVHWLKLIKTTEFRKLIRCLQKFISGQIFPPDPHNSPPTEKCEWWIPAATKVLALLHAANHIRVPPLVSYQEFYNSSIDGVDLLNEYHNWQNSRSKSRFSFCQYPFILSLTAKRQILHRDSEQQMIIMARNTLLAKVHERESPSIGMLFLNLTVRRSHLVSDSMNEIADKKVELKKKLKVTFAGEPGLDMGGLTKEWFLLLIRQIFMPDYGMFTLDRKSRVFWFSSAPCENYQEFNLIGVLMGLAVYNSIILDIRFPPVCYRKLLSPAVVPFNDPGATVGITKVSISDLRDTLPDLAHGLQELLEYEGDIEEDLDLTFQISYTELGSARLENLKPGGEEIKVTKENRQEYVQLYVEFILNQSIYKQFQAFYHGFHSVCASNALIMLRSEEVELLVCGNPSLDMEQLKQVTVYDGYTAESETIQFFWDVVLSFSLELQKQVLLFTTGSDRVPIGGMGEMQFRISRVDNLSMLPMSHTCFNQLVLPSYTSRAMVKEKLTIAINNAEGFGLE